MEHNPTKIPSPLLSLVPILVLVTLLFVTIRIFGSDALSGGSQIVLLTATAICCLIAMTYSKVRWKALELAMINNITGVATALIILLSIGALSGSWMISGVVPTLIYYGMQIIHPSFFLASTCIICAVVSVMTGSSWTTIATIGIALLGIGQAQGFSDGWIAGAIISGAYFGDKISLLGTKSSDSQKLATVIDCDEVTVLSGGAVNYPEPEDISAKIDDYTSSKRGYVTVKGIFNGSSLSVSEDAKYSVSVVDAPASLGLSALTGHIVTVTGYYAGLAEPVQRIMATDVEDNGLNEIVYFLENFEWLEPWSVASGVGQTVETDNLDAKATALTSITVDGVTAFDAVEKLGYKFIYDKNDNKRIYLQQNYLKFGKTGNHAGIILPPIDGVPEAKDNVTLSFDWCGMRQGSGKIDPVNLIVIFENGSDKVQIDIPELGWEEGHKLEWVRAEVSLKGITVNKDTKITITQTQWDVSTANRWFLDNIKISEPIQL